MKNRSISSQNVDSANIYNHGIVKAGDGGNGRRGADGRGGTDKTDGTAPTNGTKGSAGGNKGEQGKAYYYGDVYTATQTDKHTISGTLTNGTAGTAGSQGNDGWGGLNLNKYYYENDYHRESDVGGHYEKEIGTFYIYYNGGRDENGSEITSTMYISIVLEMGKKSSKSSGFYTELSSNKLTCRFVKKNDTAYTDTNYETSGTTLFLGSTLYYKVSGKMRYTAPGYDAQRTLKLTMYNAGLSTLTSAVCYDYLGNKV